MSDSVHEFLSWLAFVGVAGSIGVLIFASDADWRGVAGIALVGSVMLGFFCGLIESNKTSAW
jgi:hypothetical protein